MQNISYWHQISFKRSIVFFSFSQTRSLSLRCTVTLTNILFLTLGTNVWTFHQFVHNSLQNLCFTQKLQQTFRSRQTLRQCDYSLDERGRVVVLFQLQNKRAFFFDCSFCVNHPDNEHILWRKKNEGDSIIITTVWNFMAISLENCMENLSFIDNLKVSIYWIFENISKYFHYKKNNSCTDWFLNI
jgi:hypothetical protein